MKKKSPKEKEIKQPEEKKAPSEKTVINKLYSTDIKTKTLGFRHLKEIGQVSTLKEQIDEIKKDRNVDGPQIYERKDHGVIPPSYFKTNEFTNVF